MQSIYKYEKASILAYIAKFDEGSICDFIAQSQGAHVISRSSHSVDAPS